MTFDPAGYWGKTWRYRDVTIERVFPSGYYQCRIEGQRLVADTLRGIRSLIREVLAS